MYTVKKSLYLADTTIGDTRQFSKSFQYFRAKPKDSHYNWPKEKPENRDKKL